MTVLPIVERELRIAARQGKTYLARVSIALAVIGVGGWLLYTMGLGRMRMGGGGQLFAVLSGMGFYACLAAGVRNSADSISREKREGTLGLLFLTDLNGYDIILGKLAAGALASFYALFATFPIFALPLMLGGVTWTQFVITMLSMATALLFSHAVGLLVSTGQKEAQKSYSAGASLLLLIVVGLPVLRYIPGPPWLSSLLTGLGLFSPGYAFANVLLRSTNTFWLSLLLVNLLALVFLALASVIVRNCWQDKAAVSLGWRERWRQWFLGSSDYRLRLRRELLDLSGYLWLISRGRFRKAGMWVVFTIVVLALVVFHVLVFDFSTPPNKPEFIFAIFALHLILKHGVAAESSRYLDVQRRNGELELLLCATPLRNSDIFHAHWLAVRRLYLTPFMVVLGIDVLLLVLGCLQDDSKFAGVPANVAYTLTIVYAIAMLVYDLWSLHWIGLWTGLSIQRPGHGAGGALTRVFGIPFVLVVFCQFPFALLRFSAAGASASTVFYFYLGLWAVICAINNGIFVAYAKAKLQTDLRAYLLPVGEQPLTLLGRLGRYLGKKI